MSLVSSVNDVEATRTIDPDALQLQKLGYKQELHRTWNYVENFCASFCALNFIGGVRSIFFLGLLAGGPRAMWSTFLISMGGMWVTAAVLAEVCSALPLSGSIYIWAAESAGPKYGRFFGFLAAWWVCTAWMTFVAGNSQTTAYYILSLLSVYEVDFPGGITTDNIQWRAVVWAVSEFFLFLAVALNHLPPKWYSRLFKFSLGLMMLDFFLNVIWLPIGASKTYGIRTTQEAFWDTYNGTGAPPAWNWILSFLFSAGVMTGFDASGHVAEETKNASVVAARGLWTSAVATGVCGFLTTILFLFCTPADTTSILSAPQPFVLVYAQALGRGGATFMTILATLGLVVNTSIAIVAASRLIFAVARDGVLPLSGWISTVTQDGQPRNAVRVMLVFGAVLLCVILPSNVAFTSLISAGGVPTIATYGLIGLLRLTMTPKAFRSSKYSLGKVAPLLYLIVVVYQGIVFAVDISPFFFPVTSAANFNFACVIFGAATVFAILSWWYIPEDQWLRRASVERQFKYADGVDTGSATPSEPVQVVDETKE